MNIQTNPLLLFTITGLGIFGAIVSWFFSLLIAGFCLQYVLQYWLAFILKAPVALPFFLCCVCGIFIGRKCVVAALLTLLLSYAIPNSYYVAHWIGHVKAI